MAVFPGLRQRPPSELMRWFVEPDAAPGVPEEERPLWLDEVAALIARSGPAGIAFLLQHLPQADDARLRAILMALPLARARLSARRRAEICTISRSLLGDSRPLIVAEAIDTLRSLGCPDAEDEVLALLKHPSPYVVGSVLRFLARSSPERAVPVLVRALESEHPIVRQNAVDELDDLNYVPALPSIRRLLTDADEYVRQAADTAVKNLEDAQESE